MKSSELIISSSSLRQRLRDSTDDIHQLLHRNAGMKQLISAHCSIADYTAVLTVFFQFYCKLEHHFDAIYQEQRFAHEATPLQWLAQDFLIMNLAKPAVSDIPALQIADYILPQHIEAYIGYLYVKQGSTLGGQTIGKCLGKSLALEAGISQFFFSGFGHQTGYYWKEFLDYLARCEPHLDEDLVVQSARFCFSILNELFTYHFSSGDTYGQQ